MKLQEIFEKYKGQPKTFIDDMAAEWGGDKGSAHSYIDSYEKYFSPFKNKKLNLLEIGVMYGSSVKMWKEYFENGNIYGMDIRPHCTKYSEDRIKIFLNDATNKKSTENLLLTESLKFDLIIDDGSHRIQDQVDTLEILWPFLNVGGVYVIEDIQDIDNQRLRFENIVGAQIIDLRGVKSKYDDVLIVIEK